MHTLYRRPLPEPLIPFASRRGQELFSEALSAGAMSGYFRLAQQFHTQAEPAFCSLGSLVVALNALDIDPGRLWQGPWRWFSEDMLDCCVPLEQIRASGMSLDDVACLARCNGADAAVYRPDAASLDELRAQLVTACSAENGPVLIAAYNRATLKQTGAGHYSPLAGYHAASDSVLILDVARFKYPPHWVALSDLYRAFAPLDAATGKSRGWLSLTASARRLSIGFWMESTAPSWAAMAATLRRELIEALSSDMELAEAARLFLHGVLASGLNARTQDGLSPEHSAALVELRDLLVDTELWQLGAAAQPAELDPVVASMLIAAAPRMWLDRLPAKVAEQWSAMVAATAPRVKLEAAQVTAQIETLLASR